MGATTRGPVRLDAVSVTACDVLSRVDTCDQPACTCACAVRDEEAAGSNPATPTQVTGHLRSRVSPRKRKHRRLPSRHLEFYEAYLKLSLKKYSPTADL